MDSIRTSSHGQCARASGEVDLHVGLRVRMRRAELGVSQLKLAEQLGISPQQLKKYERGANRIGAGRLHQIATALDTPIGYFFQNIDAGDDDGGLRSDNSRMQAIADALGDDATYKLLCMFAAVDDPALRSRVVQLVEAVIE